MAWARTTVPRVAILGAGPAGLAAAWLLQRQGKARVTVLEEQPVVGGSAASFRVAGIPVDLGSHRLHPACDPAILTDLQELLGSDLLVRRRRDRIRLRDHWIHFPIRPTDVVRLSPAFALGVVRDAFLRLARRRRGASHDTFASVLEHGLGHAICRDFYFPYATKMWGVRPERLSAEQARRRVSAGSLQKLLRTATTVLPRAAASGASHYLYPRHGFGQISDALAAAARRAGADLRTRVRVRGIRLGPPHRILAEADGATDTLECDHLWSTIPVTSLARLVDPAPPPAVLTAAERITFRAMVFVYLVLETGRFSEYDAHYFPDPSVTPTRVSEPRNHSGCAEPQDRTVLCAELPCAADDATWTATDDELADVVAQSLARSGCPLRTPVREVVTRRLRHAYPVYLHGYEAFLERLDRWLGELDGIVTFGRQGLFAHDHTHHALAMAYSAAECLGTDGRFRSDRWREHRAVFTTHVVED